jgi:hypothetical protein
MDERPVHLERFVKAVHRRAIALRIIESMAVGLVVGGLAAIVLLAICIATHRDAAWLAMGLLAIGALAGIVGGVLNLPSLIAAAHRADRQLHLHDLLSTAMAFRSNTVDPWAAIVVRQADQSARSLRAGDVVLRRLTLRAWGGVGLSAAAVMVLIAISALPDDVRATNGQSTQSSASALSTEANAIRRGPNTWTAPRQTEAESSSNPRTIQDRSSSTGAGPTRDASAGGSSPGGGIAASHGGASAPSVPPTGSAPANDSGKPTRTGDGGQVDHAFQNQRDEPYDGSPTGKITGSGDFASPARVPAGGSTGHAWDRADMSVPLAGVPDAYRDVVRSYFSASHP